MEKLDTLRNKLYYKEWKLYFDSAKTYDRGKNLDTLSIKLEIEKYGISWPANIETQKPAELAAALINHIGDIGVPVPVVTRKAIQNKLMFFLWDNVFSRDRKPLQRLLKEGGATDKEPRTFGEFSSENNVSAFIAGVMMRTPPA